MHRRPGRAVRAAGTAGRYLRRAAPHTLTVVALTLLSAAAFQADTTIGLAASGLSCLILDWRIRDGSDPREARQ